MINDDSGSGEDSGKSPDQVVSELTALLTEPTARSQKPKPISHFGTPFLKSKPQNASLEKHFRKPLLTISFIGDFLMKRLLATVLLALCMAALPAFSQGTFPVKGDDTTTSLGSFRIE